MGIESFNQYGGPDGLTNQTAAVSALMKQANLSAEFSNYRLDGVQVKFTNPDGSPTLLGNSVIEGENVGMTKGTASCITCLLSHPSKTMVLTE